MTTANLLLMSSFNAEDFELATRLVAGNAHPRPTEARNRAEEWLQAFLEQGPRRATAVLHARGDAGIAEITLQRAKIALGVQSRQKRAETRSEWYWELPTNTPAPPETPRPKENAMLERVFMFRERASGRPLTEDERETLRQALKNLPADFPMPPTP